EWRANHRFVETDCVVLNHRVRQQRQLSDRTDTFYYAPEVLIRYSVDDREYRVWAYSVIQSEIAGLEGEAVALVKLSRFQKGKSYPCWYDPEQPDHAVLFLGYTWYIFRPLLATAA